MISPGMSCCEHTLNTLRYADRLVQMIGPRGVGDSPIISFFLYLLGVKKVVLVPLTCSLCSLKRSKAGAVALPFNFRALNRNNMTGD